MMMMTSSAQLVTIILRGAKGTQDRKLNLKTIIRKKGGRKPRQNANAGKNEDTYNIIK